MAECKNCIHLGVCGKLIFCERGGTVACDDYKNGTDCVEVVRCKDCKYWLNSWVAPGAEHSHGYCHIEESDDVVVGRWDDDFCSYGERKDHEASQD